MEKNQVNPDRNRPADKGRNNDPYTRDDSGQRPGASTMSESEHDEELNRKLSRTASDNFREKDFGADADPDFDEVVDDIDDDS
ncbi:hypothetical protein OCK74_17015 [Chitinophagaceae bacterium LB-8]|uniref:Uncharacterized protein n=1 Tax=Paraflavisolibacter caeni TaxID=2982496 RepID=A0A9X3BJ77_9BACT|nr:hypothetical protein [Paraflavisolibacter caeni]MCU7550823.1 hypothetical protein [Paraflavisolibacter caeni]